VGVIALLDYGAGNLRSVEKALRHIGADVQIVQRPENLRDAHAAVLPGVGAFDDCIHSLQRQELFEATRDYIRSGRPFLGICVAIRRFEKVKNLTVARWLGNFAGQVVPSKRQRIEGSPVGWNNDCAAGLSHPAGNPGRELCLFCP
jgi:glutamine amidotransferase